MVYLWRELLHSGMGMGWWEEHLCLHGSHMPGFNNFWLWLWMKVSFSIVQSWKSVFHSPRDGKHEVGSKISTALALLAPLQGQLSILGFRESNHTYELLLVQSFRLSTE